MTAVKSKRRRVVLLLLPLICGGALWVNLPLLRGLLSDAMLPDDTARQPMPDPFGAPPAPSAEAATTAAPISQFTAFLPQGDLPDPFAHPTTDSSAAASRTGDPERPLPVVLMVLCTDRTRRALIDDALVGVGDGVGGGTVTRIDPTGVVWRTKDGPELTLPLRPRSESKRRSDPDRAPVDDELPAPPPENHR